jgi:type I restriction enzyme M protein
MEEIDKNEYNLNISRYVSTAEPEEIIDIGQVNRDLREIEKKIHAAKETHNEFLRELGLSELP